MNNGIIEFKSRGLFLEYIKSNGGMFVWGGKEILTKEDKIFIERINNLIQGIDEYSELKELYDILQQQNKRLEKEIKDLQNQIQKEIKFSGDYVTENLELKKENEQLKETIKNSTVDFWKNYCTQLQNINTGLNAEIDGLKQEIKNLLTGIENIQGKKNNEKPNEKPNEKESMYKDLLYKVAKNNGFLVQQFIDYHNLVYCYNRFLQTGFEVNQVGSDTLIIRNK